MADLELKRYEISLWDDVLVTEGEGSNVYQYFDEQKLCVIGSNEMSSWARATNPIFTENTNGQKTLTFSMVTRFYDENREEFIQNPFLSLLVNERKVKLFYNPDDENDEFNNGWHDLIIKNIQENKSSNTFSYTAQSAPINELSKTGFNLEFDPELQNNMGKITELAERVVDGTDWKIRPTNEGSDLLRQYIEEPVYWYDIQDGDNVTDLAGETLDPQPTKVYIFYSQMQDDSDNEVMAALPILVGDDDLPIANDDTVLVDREGHYVPNVKVTFNEWPDPAHYGLEDHGHTYRGMRLNRHQTSVYDSKLHRYVNVYEDANHNQFYGYTETKYISPVIVQDFVVNGKDFTNTDGWDCNGNDSLKLKFETQPVTNSYLEFIPNSAESSHYLFNNGIYYMRSSIHDFTEGETYICRFKSNVEPSNIFVADYDLNNGVYEIDSEGQVYFDFDFSNVDIDEDGYYTIEANCTQSLSYEQLLRQKIGFLVKNGTNSYKVYEMQFYKKVEVDGMVLKPGDAPTQDLLEFIPRYYDPNQEGYEDIDSIVYLPDENYTPVYDEDYEKIRSITIKESNRYNIIQTLCETFECWARFEVAHESNGKIKLENGVPEKYISFHEYIGDDNYAGFRYQINLKDIQRTLVSDQLVTKIVVKANSNEFAPHGFCTIARADENPTKENFILDFSHYVQHNLLNINQITNDLYLDTSGYIGYYKKLAELNAERDEKIELLTQLLTTQNQLEAAYQVAYLADEAANKLYNTAIGEWLRYKGSEYVAYDDTIEDPMAQQIQVTIEVQRQAAESYGARVDALSEQLEENEEKVDELKHYLYEETEEGGTETLYSKKKALDAQFYKKYSRFIQEGSWISEDYVDDNLYFIDAQNTLRTSAQPQITYNISVMALDALEGYQGYRFKVGDKTYVEDEEFFGYVPGASVLTPYHEEVIVSQVQWNLDNPAQNNITVQNFKTRFQDLFQRITAQTQALQYSNGAYQKAANVVTTEGAITETALGKALIDSTLILSNARDQSVVIDESGISITDLTNYREIVRLVSGGILLSNDGGKTWSNAITGDGINANYITAGQIDTALIRVGSGAWPSFRWDANGLVAYAFDKNPETGLPQNFQFNRLVRFDQYGLYGYEGQSDFIPQNLNDVWTNAQFAVTWQGFKLNSNKNAGYVSITSDNDIQVIGINRGSSSESEVERIKIGRISETNNYTPVTQAYAEDSQVYYYKDGDLYYEVDWSQPQPTDRQYYIRDWLYGIRIKGADNTTVMETGSDGNLWLKNMLTVGDGSVQHTKTQIGWNPSSATADTHSGAHQVINANDTFIVYEDGHIKATSADITGTIHATDGEFTGTIHATGGTIGNVNIDTIVDSVQRISIDGESVVTKIGDTYTPNPLVLTSVLHNIESGGIYQWFLNDTALSGKTSASLSYDTSTLTGPVTFKVTYTKDNKTITSDNFTLSYVEMSDIDIDTYQILFNDTKVTKTFEETDLEQVIITPQPLVLSVYENSEKMTNYHFKLEVIDNKLGIATTVINNSSNASDPGFWTPLDTNVIYYNQNVDLGEINSWYFDLSSIVREDLTGKNPTNQFLALRNSVLNEQNTIRFYFYDAQNNWFATYDIPVTSVVYQSLMDFAVTAKSINASIGAGAMIFDDDGLTIRNGNFKIQRYPGIDGTNPDNLLYFDETNSVLHIEGDGVFTGTVYATDGKFSGTVEATDGIIEYLKIGTGDNYLELGSTDNFQGIRSHNQAFIIGLDGSIVANDIHLGTGAVIDDYIQLGDAFLYNPNTHDNIVFQSNDIIIKDDGTGQIGQINFNGAGSSLSGNTWSIDPQNARFYNVYAQGTLSTSVFESTSTRINGGSMIFKNGTMIEQWDQDSLWITVSDIAAVSLGYAIALKNNSSFTDATLVQIQEIDKTNNRIRVDSATGAVNNPQYLIMLGSVDSNVFNDWIIGVNSTNIDIDMVGLHRKSLSFNLAKIENGALSVTPQIILGDLTGLKFGITDVDLHGSGLYAQNVYLTGTLTTQYQELGTNAIKYAGVNTYSGTKGVPFIKSSESQLLDLDESNIVFWAGSNGTSAEHVQEAKFQVTSNGTLYARQGYFKGSIFADATIEASKLVAPLITGKATGTNNWLLTLQTADNNGGTATEQQGFRFIDAAGNTFISLTSGSAYFNNNIVLENDKNIQFNSGSQNDALVLIDKQNMQARQYQAVSFVGDDNVQTGITVNDYQLLFQNQVVSNNNTWNTLGRIEYQNDGFNIFNGTELMSQITKTGFANMKNSYLNEDVYFGQAGQDSALLYKKNQKGEGYDLYVGSVNV